MNGYALYSDGSEYIIDDEHTFLARESITELCLEGNNFSTGPCYKVCNMVESNNIEKIDLKFNENIDLSEGNLIASRCCNLKEVNITAGLDIKGQKNRGIVEFCRSLEKATVDGKNISWLFDGNDMLEDIEFKNVECFGEGTLIDMPAIKYLKIPKSTKTIKDLSIKACHNLEIVDIESEDIRIRKYAFNMCDRLKQVNVFNMPEEKFKRRNEKFYEEFKDIINFDKTKKLEVSKTDLTDITIYGKTFPEDMKIDGNKIELPFLHQNLNLRSITAPECEIIKSHDCFLKKDINIEELNFPNLVLFQSRFGSLPRLRKVSMPKLNRICSYMFENCTNLEEVNFNEAKCIENFAFINCFKLKQIDLKNVTLIEALAFKSCKALKEVSVYDCEIEGCAFEESGVERMNILGNVRYNEFFSDLCCSLTNINTVFVGEEFCYNSINHGFWSKYNNIQPIKILVSPKVSNEFYNRLSKDAERASDKITVEYMTIDKLIESNTDFNEINRMMNKYKEYIR